MKKLATLGCLAFALFATSVARADDPAVTEAKKRFAEGLGLADQGRHEEARLKFQQAAAAFGTPAVFYNLAGAEQLTGHDFDALQHYKAFLRLGEIDPKITDAMRERARTYIQELTKKAGQIEVTAPRQAKILVDGAEVDVVGRRLGDAKTDIASFELIVVSPGRHTVEAAYEGRMRSTVVDCPGGVVTKATLDFDGGKNVDAGKRETTAPAPETRDGSPTRWVVAGSLAAAGLVGVGVGIGFAAASQSAKDTENSLRTPGRCADPNSATCSLLKDARDDVDSRGTISTIGYVAGGVLLAGAAATFVFWPKKSDTRAAATPLPGGGAFVLRGSF